MSDSTRVLTNLMMSRNASLSLGESNNTFPENPSASQIAVVEGIPYIYTAISNFWSWYPMSSRKSSYVHMQGVPSNEWIVTHGLGSRDIILVCYDHENNVHTFSGLQFIDNNTLRIKFMEAIKGRAVMFATDQINTPFLQAAKIETEELAITGGDVSITSEGLLVGEKNVAEELTTLDTKVVETEQRVIEKTQKPIGNQRMIQRHPHLANIL